MKKFLLAILCICLLTAVSVAAADNTDGYKVQYLKNNCLAEVPEDDNVYQYGEEVTVLFEPVQYMNNLIFYGWDMNDDGVADFGYAYRNFTMPKHDVQLKAICISQSYSAPAPQPHHGPHPGPWGPKPGPGPRPGPGPNPGPGPFRPAPPPFGPWAR